MTARQGPAWCIGLMTGTVLDGNIDIAALRTDGETVAAFGPWTLAPYPEATRLLLVQALDAALEWGFEGPEPAVFAEAEEALTRGQSAAVLAFLAANGMAAGDIAAIGFHGQTVLHRPPAFAAPLPAREGLSPGGRLSPLHGGSSGGGLEPSPGPSLTQGGGKRAGRTRQLGDGALMAAQTGIDVVYDFRTADVAAGGQGAPLSPTYHAALLAALDAAAGTAVLNLGGVANVSWRGEDGSVVGFDTGPANAPINDWVRRHTGADMDHDGALARAGRVDEARLARLLAHPYLVAPYPKSLDRFGFPASMADGLSLADGAATLTAFTAAAVGRGLDLLPHRPTRLVVCGGGRRNPAIMAALGARAGVEAVPAEAVGWRGDAIEAECFALLAMRTLRGLPISYPATTGVPHPLPGGRVARAASVV